MHGSISYTFKYAQRFCSAYNIRICILHGVFGIWLGVRPRSSTRSTKLCCCSISFCFLALLQSLEIVCFLFRLGLAGIGFFFLFRFISLPTIECEESSCHQCNAKEGNVRPRGTRTTSNICNGLLAYMAHAEHSKAFVCIGNGILRCLKF